MTDRRAVPKQAKRWRACASPVKGQRVLTCRQRALRAWRRSEDNTGGSCLARLARQAETPRAAADFALLARAVTRESMWHATRCSARHRARWGKATPFAVGIAFRRRPPFLALGFGICSCSETDEETRRTAATEARAGGWPCPARRAPRCHGAWRARTT